MFKAFIIGNLGADAELHNENGSQFVTFKVAHNERYKDREGNQNDNSVWVSCILNGNAAGLLQYLVKGTTVAVVGDLRLKVYNSAKLHRLAAGADLFVRSIDLVGARPDTIPSRLYDTDGVQHNVSKWYYCDTAKGQPLMTLAGAQFTCDNNGWVRPVVEDVPADASLSQGDDASSVKVTGAAATSSMEGEIFNDGNQ